MEGIRRGRMKSCRQVDWSILGIIWWWWTEGYSYSRMGMGSIPVQGAAEVRTEMEVALAQRVSIQMELRERAILSTLALVNTRLPVSCLSTKCSTVQNILNLWCHSKWKSFSLACRLHQFTSLWPNRSPSIFPKPLRVFNHTEWNPNSIPYPPTSKFQAPAHDCSWSGSSSV